MLKFFNIVLYKIKTYLYNYKELNKKIKEIKNINNENIIYLFQTPIHSNIGDHAIAIAQIEFLNKYLKDYTIVEIKQNLIPQFLKNHKDIINIKDLILLHGGGNFGNEYMYEENLRRLIVSTLINNKIIVFPQTIYYTDDLLGKKELEKSKEIFSKHKNLTFTAREQVSYGLMKEYFQSNKVILTPDIVLSLNINDDIKREYALGVIRNDQESILSQEIKVYINNLLNKKFDRVIYSDMHVENNEQVLTNERRKEIFDFKINQFLGAKLVVTDRLHGMVLAAITGTPCIAFSNYNQKVSGTYNWIKDLEYIKFVNSLEEFEIAYEVLTKLDKWDKYSTKLLEDDYLPLIKALQNE